MPVHGGGLSGTGTGLSEYSNLLPNTDVRGSDQVVLHENMLLSPLVGKIGSCECGCLLTAIA
jgi:hypothetical protein